MQGFRLEKGMHLMHGGREQVIEMRLPNGDIQLKDIATNQYSAQSEESLKKALFGGDVELLGHASEYRRLKERQENTHVSDFNALEDDDPRKVEARWRLDYVQALDKVGRSRLKFTAEFLLPIIKKVGHELGDIPAAEYKLLTDEQKAELRKAGKRVQPSPITLYRWYVAWEEAANDIRALITANASKGNGDRKISKDKEKCEAVLAKIGEVIEEVYMTLERPSVQDTWNELEVRIRRENKHRNKEDELSVPHISTLYRIIDGIDEYDRDMARYGKRYADAKHKANKRGPRPTRPLERVEIDETQLPMMAIDPIRLLPIGRPWLILAIDVLTRMIVGFYLSFVRPSYAEFMQCMLHAIKPKDYVREKYPGIVKDWPVHGLWEGAFVDNAKIYYSNAFNEASYQIGTTTHYTRRFIAWDKPFIERSFLTIARRLLRKIPGTTFSNILEKADYDPKKHALVALDDLLEIIHIFIISIYHQSRHRGINDVPARLWQVSTKKFPPALPPNIRELEVLLGYIVWRSVGSSGIELFGLFYNDDGLAVLRRSLKGEKVKVKFDPEDLSLVWAYDPNSGIYIPVPALDQEYTKGLSLWQHNIIRQFARQLVDEYVDREALCQAREQIQAVVAKSVERMKSMNVKAANWLAKEEHRATFENGANRDSNNPPEGSVEVRCEPVLLNTGAHPAAGISDFNQTQSIDIDGSAQGTEAHAQSVAIELNASRKNSAKKGKKNGPRRSSNKQSERMNDAQQDSDGPDEDQAEIENVVADDELELDTSGWSADYDLPK